LRQSTPVPSYYLFIENFDILDFQLDPKEVNVISEMQGEPLNEYWEPQYDAEVDVGDTSHGVNLKRSIYQNKQEEEL